jgi:hypothetical protein
MVEHGSFRERWQYRQEMKAHGAWGHWGFPTREDYAQFHDARNLADLVKTWRPNNVEAYGLGEQGLTPLLQADKEEAYALLNKRMESGLSEAEVRTYAQLVNRWQAEHAMLAGGEGQGPSAERAQIETNTERLKQELQGMGDTARAHAYDIGVDGLTIGEKGNTLFTGGRGDWEAPKIHPVWAPEVAREAEIVERMGSATFEYEPQRRKLAEWAAAGKPEVRGEEEHDVARSEPHRTTEDLGFVLGAPERREITQSEAAVIEARTDVLREREALVEERIGPLASPHEGERWLHALRERLAAVTNTSDTPAVRQRPEGIAERLADLLEEAQRQGLVVTGQETPQVPHKQRRGY